MRVVIYTALFGGHSTLKEFDTRGVPCVCFTDNEDLRSETWKMIHEPMTLWEPRRQSKLPKMSNPLAAEYDLTIWIDSTITVTRVDRLVAECAAALEGKEVALFLHPERTSILTEAGVSASMPKYAGQDVVGQAERYLREGLPADHKLYAGGVIARSSPLVRLSNEWMSEMSFSLQDQISLPFVLWKLGIEPGVIPGSVYGTDYHQHHWEGPDR